MSFKVQLAPQDVPALNNELFAKMPFPFYVSPKFDGIRGFNIEGTLYSRNFKPISSTQCQSLFGDTFTELDGELVEGSATDENCLHRTQSYVRSKDKTGDMRFFVFDTLAPEVIDLPFKTRYEYLLSHKKDFIKEIVVVEQKLVSTVEELKLALNEYIEEGYEGGMIRNPSAPYRNGRCTFRDGVIYKYKEFEDDWAEIVRFEEQYTNTNEKFTDELGFTARSDHKENLVPADTLGKIVAIHKGIEINIAVSRFDHETRKLLWDARDHYTGKHVKFRHFPYGMKNKPRLARALSFADQPGAF